MSRFGAISVYFSFWFLLTAGFLFAGAPIEKHGDRPVPKAAFPELRYNFGEGFEGAEIKYDFIVENQGGAPLVIKNIRPD